MQNWSSLAVLVSSLLFAGCSGEKEKTPPDGGSVSGGRVVESASHIANLRAEFVAVRELVRQHELQAGNEIRIKTVESMLKERLSNLPDGGKTDEEKTVVDKAKNLLALTARNVSDE